jgi:hypothetical protein
MHFLRGRRNKGGLGEEGARLPDPVLCAAIFARRFGGITASNIFEEDGVEFADNATADRQFG